MSAHTERKRVRVVADCDYPSTHNCMINDGNYLNFETSPPKVRLNKTHAYVISSSHWHAAAHLRWWDVDTLGLQPVWDVVDVAIEMGGRPNHTFRPLFRYTHAHVNMNFCITSIWPSISTLTQWLYVKQPLLLLPQSLTHELLNGDLTLSFWSGLALMDWE